MVLGLVVDPARRRVPRRPRSATGCSMRARRRPSTEAAPATRQFQDTMLGYDRPRARGPSTASCATACRPGRAAPAATPSSASCCCAAPTRPPRPSRSRRCASGGLGPDGRRRRTCATPVSASDRAAVAAGAAALDRPAGRSPALAGRLSWSTCRSPGRTSCTSSSPSSASSRRSAWSSGCSPSAGVALVLLLGAIAFVVTRQVVTPVRQAARRRGAARRRPARRADAAPAARTTWPGWRARSTRWPPACRTRSASWRSCRGCSGGSSPTSRTSCARR